MTDIKSHMAGIAEEVEVTLGALLPEVSGARNRVIAAMRYGSLGGGKRLRPFLVVESAALFGVDRQHALRTGAALEMIHCYSLIHDDLPAMDDADTRRGRPSVHKAYDDATAILAGDGLLTEAFAVLADPKTHPKAEVRISLVAGLAEAAGIAGMVGGQMIDISEEKLNTIDGITELQRLKTGALIRFGCEAGAILGEADELARKALVQYATDLGLAFQVVDDLLDVEADEAELGKPIGQDADMGKATFVQILGKDGARDKARDLVDSACARLSPFGGKAGPLKDVARFVFERRS